MAKLTIIWTKCWDYSFDGDVILGRHPDCEIAVDSASLQHARIVRIGDDFWIEDLRSHNGTFLNGKIVLIKKQKLCSGDEIRIGDVLFVFSDSAAEDIHGVDADSVTDETVKTIVNGTPPEPSEDEKISWLLNLWSQDAAFVKRCFLGVDHNLGRKECFQN